jgi:hypothetical protein
VRLTTDFWVSAIVRRAFGVGGFAAIIRRGSSEAGAVLLVRRDRMGEIRLYAPAPQTSYPEEGRPDDRLFAEVLRTTDEDELTKKIGREEKFDPDLWVVELEIDDAQFLTLVSVTTP